MKKVSHTKRPPVIIKKKTRNYRSVDCGPGHPGIRQKYREPPLRRGGAMKKILPEGRYPTVIQRFKRKHLNYSTYTSRLFPKMRGVLIAIN